ncbi:hypothetical protein HR060_10385 [Catenovulum sp. SM1970]|uniref:hypothetical protein n=1 Tax=Marinifaba aquimaris TaxID=2741323 RepID=UPI001571CD17|nr:hypothetical protein [Marinifaba aquimaris]NTS77271.1 hypothetical protein [Marinifaba aquimaris]
MNIWKLFKFFTFGNLSLISLVAGLGWYFLKGNPDPVADIAPYKKVFRDFEVLYTYGMRQNLTWTSESTLLLPVTGPNDIKGIFEMDLISGDYQQLVETSMDALFHYCLVDKELTFYIKRGTYRILQNSPRFEIKVDEKYVNERQHRYKNGRFSNHSCEKIKAVGEDKIQYALKVEDGYLTASRHQPGQEKRHSLVNSATGKEMVLPPAFSQGAVMPKYSKHSDTYYGYYIFEGNCSGYWTLPRNDWQFDYFKHCDVPWGSKGIDYHLTKAGWFITRAGYRKSSQSAWFKSNKLWEIEYGEVQKISVSPDGCKVAYAHNAPMKTSTSHFRMTKDFELVIFDACAFIKQYQDN